MKKQYSTKSHSYKVTMNVEEMVNIISALENTVMDWRGKAAVSEDPDMIKWFEEKAKQMEAMMEVMRN